ncbi:hypothetical protein E3A20_19450 [Planctomyces bekefii]|uniref:Uncharacterized protein n=1 Tax=Planctomyces bekefii TaxID=1653850 RepID=A0A5C6M468_9PLAN|nr:hypothetical protein E3A20_19450 [Planctomyces bekefii]
MALGPPRTWLALVALLTPAFVACKKDSPQSKVKNLTAPSQESVVLAFTAPLHEDIRKLYAAI